MDHTTGRVVPKPGAGRTLPDDVEHRAREIRADIADTRNDMSDTINAIQDRLSPGYLTEQATEAVRTAATEKVKHMANTASDAMDQVFGTSVMDTVRANPVPAAMIVIGAAWLFTRRRSNGDNNDRLRRSARSGLRYDPGATTANYGAVGTRGSFEPESRDSIVDQARETLGNLSDHAASAANEVGAATRRTGRRARVQLQDVLHHNPLALGAAAALVGAVIGMTVPETDAENDLMGDARDAVVDRAREFATDRVSDAGSTLIGLTSPASGQSTTRQERDEQPPSGSDSQTASKKSDL